MFAAACNGTNNFTTTVLATPIGLTVAGPSSRALVFVANAEEDTLQMLRQPQLISNTNFVRGPARYFPLRIQVGSRPTKLAHSDYDTTIVDDFDPENVREVGGNQWVVVLDTARESDDVGVNSVAELSLVNAIDQIPQLTADTHVPVHFAFADGGAVASDMVGAPGPCKGVFTEQDVDADNDPSTPPIKVRTYTTPPLPNAALGCMGRYYVAMQETGTILAVDLVPPIDQAKNFTAGDWFQIAASYNVGGSPRRLAISTDGLYLFIGDAAEGKVTRLGVGNGVQGSIDQRDVGGIPGPLAVSRDNTTLLVGRPVQRDLIVMNGANDSTWGLFDANGIFAPQPRCLFACTGDTTSCEGAYDSDREICIDDVGLRSSGSANYPAIFLDAVPSQITTLGQAEQTYTDTYANKPLLYDCKQIDLDTNNDGSVSSGENDRDSTISVSYEEYAMVVIEGDRLTGNIIWLPLKAKANGPLTPMVANGACAQASIDISATYSETGAVYAGAFSDYAIGNYLAPCIAVPDRNRFSCFTDASGGGFVVLPGNTPLANASLDGPIQHQGTYNFRWEGILQGLDRTNGGGELVDEGTETQNAVINGVATAVPMTHVLADVGLDYSAFQRVKPGDILEILSAPTSDAACDAVLTQQYGTSRDVCNFERHIVGVTTQADGTAALRFDDPPIPVSCLLNQGRVAYKVRAGHQFLVDRNNQAAWRMDLDDQFGPGGATGTTEAVMFRMRSDLADTTVAVSACNRYDSNGSVLHAIPAAIGLDTNGNAPVGEECDGLVDGAKPSTENNQAVVDCAQALADERNPDRDPTAPLSSDLAFCHGYCQSGILGRLVGFNFTVYDPYRPYIGGRSYGSSGTATTASDSIPGDIIVFQDQNTDDTKRKNARLFMTFSGSNTLVVLDPTNAQNATTAVQDIQLILRN